MSPQPTQRIISDRPINAPRPLKVIYIGAGVSGIIAAIQFRKLVPSIDLAIYEKNPEIGGTWYENVYPGVACDIPSHSYQLSFESWTEWGQFYATGPEIWEYWNRVANKYNVKKDVRFNHKCIEASWDERRSKWTVKIERLDTNPPTLIHDEADVFITGTGLLNEWKWPAIDGLHSFKGELLHTANWNQKWDATDKTVAVIGAGSSGIQVVPALVSKVKAMDHYVRGKTWISNQQSEGALKQRTADNKSTNFDYDIKEKEAWKGDAASYIAYRKTLELDLQSMVKITHLNTPQHANARVSYEKYMKERLVAKPELMDQLIPSFPPLCKRLTPGPGYLEALTEPHVNVISEAVVRIDSDAVITADGVRRPVDAIICATGFETNPGKGFPIYGRDGINLRDKYKTRPRTYLSLCTDNFPNFFQSLGPNGFQGAGSLLITIEHAHLYMAKILHRLAHGNILTIEPKRKQVDNFTNFCDEYFKQTVYVTDCVSWYKSSPAGTTNNERKAARVSALWPGSSVHALHAFSSVRWEDFDMEASDGNDFGWFGNGLTVADGDPSNSKEELTWYLNGTNFLDEPLS
ncbi:hypothetical protein BGZ61DRAFT_355017 [Ilyonectria robusta]|uniref:uncharacterized protein n=1 Tax=Ilyonectria robusta TaxID=1079257 RepID=UPI001E8E1DCB|nr:uncharacterized protein BGZ61DRAFT_355017 [Ilyonectria robusta]KAH8686321.1 hypothetical protein BGZ61DRAFT_355017 [Ilyonectria robusta]